LDTGRGHWYTSPIFQEVRAAKAWTGNWDTWQQASDESRGIMMEYYQEEQKMEAWESKEQQRQAAAKSK
jgi:hypothetical protein